MTVDSIEVGIEPIDSLLPPSPVRAVDPLLAAMAEQAPEADRTRSLDPDLVKAIKANDIMSLAATPEIGGLGASILQIGRELEAVAAACTSTAWVLWNHLAVFHLFAGALGPGQRDLLAGIVERREWVCFPAGAGSGVAGRLHDSAVEVSGRGAFSTGGRYADWAGVVFAVTDDEGRRAEPLDLRFTVVGLETDGVTIDQTWDGGSVRASATDDVHYRSVEVPVERCVPWFGANRAESLRSVPVVSHRYREDWVGLSDVWLMWMGVGLARSALRDAAIEIRDRRAIMGRAMVTKPTVQINLGQAAALVASAAATASAACAEIDDRIEGAVVPTEADYLRQMALSTSAINQLTEAMSLIVRSSGGNGLREGRPLERRWRDFQAVPLHINAHQDRVHHQLGRFTLGLDLEPF